MLGGEWAGCGCVCIMKTALGIDLFGGLVICYILQ